MDDAWLHSGKETLLTLAYCRRLPPVTALGSRQLLKGRRQLPAHFPFISQKNNQTNFLHYFVALNMLHLLTLLFFLIYIQVRISLLKIAIERLSWC